MSPNDQEIFWQLGRNATTGGPLPPAYRCAREVASTICEDLSQVGLSKAAIKRVACALLDVSISSATKRNCATPSDRQPRGGHPR